MTDGTKRDPERIQELLKYARQHYNWQMETHPNAPHNGSAAARLYLGQLIEVVDQLLEEEYDRRNDAWGDSFDRDRD